MGHLIHIPLVWGLQISGPTASVVMRSHLGKKLHLSRLTRDLSWDLQISENYPNHEMWNIYKKIYAYISVQLFMAHHFKAVIMITP